MFPESENPSRVFVVIVESSAYLGSYANSPFTFKRNWEVIGGVLDNVQNSLQSENNFLKSSINDIKSQMSILVNLIQSQNSRQNNDTECDSDKETEKNLKRRKGKQKQTNTKKSNIDAQPSTSSLLGRLYNSFQNEPSEHDAMSDVCSEQDIEPRPSDVCSGLGSERLQGTTNYYITNVELELMSSPLDQFNSRGTEDEAMSDYVRLQKSINQYNQVISCGLSYDHFLKGAFIAAFDLTTNQQPGLAYAVNTVRTGITYFFVLKF